MNSVRNFNEVNLNNNSELHASALISTLSKHTGSRRATMKVAIFIFNKQAKSSIPLISNKTNEFPMGSKVNNVG